MISLSLLIDFTATPIRGTLQDDGGRQYEFVGWLGLSDRLRLIGEDTAPEETPTLCDEAATTGP